jgi:hypothetical protein
MDNDDDIDTSGIPDFAPNPQWAKGPPDLVKTMLELRGLAVPEITRDTVINQLYIEAMDRKSKTQTARIMAWKLICDLKGYTESTNDIETVKSDKLTPEEMKAIAREFQNTY